jgi:hypothetical protein
VVFLAINGIVGQAEVLQHRVIAGQLARARVAADADTLRAATLEAATNSDPAQAAKQLELAKSLVKQFPDDARTMVRIFCPPKSNKDYQAESEISCAQNTDPIAKEIGSYVDTFRESASLYDFQALTAVGALTQGNKKAALQQIGGDSAPAYQKQSRDRTACRPATSG